MRHGNGNGNGNQVIMSGIGVDNYFGHLLLFHLYQELLSTEVGEEKSTYRAFK